MRGFCGKQLNMGQNMFCLVLEQFTDNLCGVLNMQTTPNQPFTVRASPAYLFNVYVRKLSQLP